ncbi:pyridoxamine 5'-phosphate oxidase family protein [Mycolicibacterium thermoresistibile]
MSVDLGRLAEALADFDYAFLITAGDAGKPHTVMLDPVLADGVFDVGAVGDRTSTNVAQHPDVTLLWPPRQPGGYALMVDGRAEAAGDGLRVVPTKALLHRRAAPGSPAAESGCLHDCVVFKD